MKPWCQYHDQQVAEQQACEEGAYDKQVIWEQE